MANTFSTVSGTVGIIALGIQSVDSLLRTIKDFRTYPSVVAQLAEDLVGLQAVLESLKSTAAEGTHDFSNLERLLKRCGDACDEFEQMIQECTARSAANRKSFRDWATIRYKGEDINTFKERLASYKSTITVALCDANLRSTNITKAALQNYQAMIQTTTCDIDIRLQAITNELRALVGNDGGHPSRSTEAQQDMIEEQNMLKQCLLVCSQASANIDTLQATLHASIKPKTDGPAISNRDPSFRLNTVAALKDCSSQLQTASMWLQSYLLEAEEELHRTSQVPGLAHSFSTKQRLEEEIKTLHDSRGFCEAAAVEANRRGQNIFEDMSLAEDSYTVLVSTVGDLITARNIKTGPRSRQVMGQMSDESLQVLACNDADDTREKSMPTPETKAFESRYGSGRNLPQEASNANSIPRPA